MAMLQMRDIIWGLLFLGCTGEQFCLPPAGLRGCTQAVGQGKSACSQAERAPFWSNILCVPLRRHPPSLRTVSAVRFQPSVQPHKPQKVSLQESVRAPNIHGVTKKRVGSTYTWSRAPRCLSFIISAETEQVRPPTLYPLFLSQSYEDSLIFLHACSFSNLSTPNSTSSSEEKMLQRLRSCTSLSPALLYVFT